MAKALSKNNTVTLVLTNKNAKAELEGANINSSDSLEIVYLPHKKNLRTLFLNTLKIVRLAKRLKPDILHFQEESHEYQTAAMLLLRKLPLVLTVHDPTPHTGEDAKSRSLFERRKFFYSKMQRRLADGLITHGEFLRDQLQSITIKNKIIHNIHHGPLGLLFDEAKPRSKNTAFTFLFFGRMQKYKGINLFIQAIESLAKEGLNIQGVLAGSGPELNKQELSLTSKPYFIVKNYYLSPKEVATTFDESDVIVMPYIDGTQSGVAALAIGRRKPSIVTNVGSLPEMVVDGKTGIVIEPNKLEALIDAMRLLYNNDKLDEMSRLAKRAGDNEKSWRLAACKTIELYQSVLDQKS